MGVQSSCPVCLSDKTEPLKSMPMYPAIVFPVDVNVDVDKKDLEIHRCDACSHIFQVNIDLTFNERLYTKYYKYYPYSNAEFFLEHYRAPFERLFETFIASRTGGDLLEIGVSDAQQLSFFEQYDFKSIGITPEDIQHPQIISSFYEDYQFDQKINAIISRFNLEHIVDLDVFMSKVKNDLNEGGMFIAQVPNIQAYTQDNILNFYVHEHIHYFNIKSLPTLLKRYGFSVEAIYSHASPSLLIIGIKDKDEKIKKIDDYNKQTADIKGQIAKVADAHITENKKVIFYGAGLSLNDLLHARPSPLFTEKTSNIVIFDDNPIIEGKNMPSSKIAIQPYNKNEVGEGDLIILTLNAVYHEKVISKIRGDGLQNQIFCINRSGLEKVENA